MVRRLQSPRVSSAAGAGRMVLLAAVIGMSAAIAAPPANAQAFPARRPGGDGPVNSNNGNGTGNYNYSAFNSPTNMRGLQQVSVSISTRTNTQNAFCKKRAHGCKIVQNIHGNR